MDFGDGVFFVEETSLACAPPLSGNLLRERLYSRLSHRGVEIQEIIHEGSVESELMFAGHNAWKFKKDPFYSNGFVPSVKELVNRIASGD